MTVFGHRQRLRSSRGSSRLFDRSALDQRKAWPGEIAETAKAGGTWNIMRPYLEALTPIAKPPVNLAASITDRLLNLAGRDPIQNSTSRVRSDSGPDDEGVRSSIWRNGKMSLLQPV